MKYITAKMIQKQLNKPTQGSVLNLEKELDDPSIEFGKKYSGSIMSSIKGFSSKYKLKERKEKFYWAAYIVQKDFAKTFPKLCLGLTIMLFMSPLFLADLAEMLSIGPWLFRSLFVMGPMILTIYLLIVPQMYVEKKVLSEIDWLDKKNEKKIKGINARQNY